MKEGVKSTLLFAVLVVFAWGCKGEMGVLDISSALDYCAEKAEISMNALEEADRYPRSIEPGQTEWDLVGARDWTSGFWPGVLWYAYEHTGDDAFRKQAERFTAPLEIIANTSAKDHDIGFQVYCSFGNGYRLTGNEAYKTIMLAAADTLATLYNPKVGTILSWPFRKSIIHNTIIDNMMNLELLFWAAKNGGSQHLYDIAVRHAETCMNTIVRPDHSTFHVGIFDTVSGHFVKGITAQGYADDSQWARGQAWGIYGYAVCYRETGNPEFLKTAQRMADLFISRLPDDVIPFWDFDDPAIPDAPKDASAAAVASCGMLELYNLVEDTASKTMYRNAATAFLEHLTTTAYLSGDTNHAILLHSTGHHPKGSEIDASIIYADYYYMEALLRLQKIEEQDNDMNDDQTAEADVVIYGGTSAAVTTAVQVARMGKSVLVVSPDIHLGGLSAGGLGWTDTGNKEVIGGLAREFYHRIWKHYQEEGSWKWQRQSEYGNRGQGTLAIDGDKRTMWIFEPHVAERVFEDFIREEGITVYRNEWLNRESGVSVRGGKIESISTLSGKKFRAEIFVDATYEGDLMASAGVTYHVGREANSVYNENWNGIQTGVLHHDHWFKSDVSPYKIPGDPASGVLPLISTEDPGIKGEGDHRIQAYCFRLCMTNHPDNRIPFPRPDNYDPAQYELLSRVFRTGWREQFRKFDPIPNKKTDTNNHGPVSSDYIGMNYDYPEAGYERRKEIIAEHENYQKGLLYFMCNDPGVPEDVRSAMNEWGLARDEFMDNDNWPHQMYIREARRMIGEYVTTENDITGKYDTPRSVGMGSYTMDSHNVQRYIKPDGFVQNEGDIGVGVKDPYKISYGSLLPIREECGNLLVPVCVSSSHIAFGSIRMEPVFMILGQSAGTAAAFAVEKKMDLHDISFDELRTRLITDGQILELP